MTSQGPHQFIIKIYSSRYPRRFTRDIPSIMPVSTGFRESNGDTRGSPSDNQTKDPSLVSIINTSNGPSETKTKDPFHVPKTHNILMAYPSEYPTGATRTMSTENLISKPIAHASSDQMFASEGSKMHK